MSWVVLFIFLFTDLFMVGVCYAFYAHKDQYEQGMLWGVHIPREACEDADVKRILVKWKKAWKRFFWFHMLVGAAVCFLNFVGVAVFMIVWAIWMVVFIVDLMRLSMQPHREMYALKMEKNWIQESKKQLLCVDTKVSATVQKMVPTPLWHLLGIAIIVGSAILGKTLLVEPKEISLTFFVISLIVSALFFGLHFFVRRMHNSVYSKDSEINLALNQSYKYDWAIGTLLADGGNVLAWLWICIRLAITGEFSNLDVMVYILIQLLLQLGILIPLVHGQRKKKALLAKDPKPIYVDDDVYWKNGWYSNPNDHRLLVQNRLCDTNYSFNFARPAARVLCAVIYGVVVLGLLLLVYVMIPLLNIHLEITQTQNTVTIEEAGYDISFQKDEVQSVKLLEKEPDTRFTKKNGVGTDKYSVGKFWSRDLGDCMLFLQEECTPVLQIQLKDQLVFLNSETEGEMETLYGNLKK
ncbi:MAG: hypothetical protein ACI4HI_17710 [Lachnospiraceae bacterium]